MGLDNLYKETEVMSEDMPMGFDDEDLERFLVLLDQRQLSPTTTRSLVWQFKKLKEKLRVAVEALEFIETKTYSDPLGIEELNCRAARVYDKAREVLAKIKGD